MLQLHNLTLIVTIVNYFIPSLFTQMAVIDIIIIKNEEHDVAIVLTL